jgi:hypothetical protein
MVNEDLGIIVMFHKLFPETKRVENASIFTKIIENAEKKAGGKITAVELDNLDLEACLKSLLPEERINGPQSFAPGSGPPPENKNMIYRLIWLAAYVLAMQYSAAKQ